MQLIELEPCELAEHAGFVESVAKLKAEAELPLFAKDVESYDVQQYQNLHDLGYLKCVAVISDAGKLLGWGVLMTLPTPRRNSTMYTTDAMYSEAAGASFLMLRRFLKIADGAPVVITASVGGRLDRALSNSSIGTKTHHVYNLHP